MLGLMKVAFMAGRHIAVSVKFASLFRRMPVDRLEQQGRGHFQAMEMQESPGP